MFGVSTKSNLDKISHYQIDRYISCNEGVWRNFGFKIYERDAIVIHLVVHLKTNNECISRSKTYRTEQQIHFLIDYNLRGKAVVGQDGVFSWNDLGIIYTAHMNIADCFYLSLFLITVHSPSLFIHLRTVDGIVQNTYQICVQGT